MKRVVCIALIVLLLLPVFLVTGYAADDEGGIVSGIVDGLLSGLKKLFIPDSDFMSDMVEDIQARFDKKFAGTFTAVGYLRGRFADLRAYRGGDDLFKVKFPPGSFLHGISVNFLTPGKDLLVWVRFCMTGVFTVFTAVACYRKVIRLIQR